MPSSTEIANQAISHLGIGKEIANLDTELSQEAAACRRFYTTAVESVLREWAWPFSTRIAALGLVEEDPNTEWGYSYRYPSDCLFLRRILSGTRNDGRDTRVPYKIAGDSSGALIFSDQEDAVCEYTYREDDSSKYPSDFVEAVGLKLATLVVPRLTAGDPFKMGDRAQRLYDIAIDKARAAASNEEQPEDYPDSEFIRTRG